MERKEKVQITNLPNSLVDYEKIVGVNFSDLLTFQGINTRPDSDGEVMFGLPKKIVTKAVSPFYLKFDGKEFLPSKTKTPFCLYFNVDNCLPTILLKSDFGGRFKNVGLEKSLCKSLPIFDVGKFALYGPDKVLATYGKNEALYRIFYNNSFVTVREKDWFFIESGNLVRGTKKGYPLICVDSISPFRLTFWDKEGFLSKTEILPLSIGLPLDRDLNFLSMGKNFLTFRAHGGFYSTRRNDWMVLNKGVWTSLKSSKDLQDFLKGTIIGNLLVYNGIEEVGSESFYTCTLFNATRDIFKKVLIKKL